MQPPAICKILIIDALDGLLRSAVSPVFEGLDGIYEPCEHLYEAVRVLSDMPSDIPVITLGTTGEFLKENGSFFAFLSKRPNILCIALDTLGRDYPYPLRQAIWHGQFLVCRSEEDMQQTLRWALYGPSVTKSVPCQSHQHRPLEKEEYKISPEELDALFNPSDGL